MTEAAKGAGLSSLLFALALRWACGGVGNDQKDEQSYRRNVLHRDAELAKNHVGFIKSVCMRRATSAAFLKY